MKQRNIIILIVGIILVGLLLISGMTNLNFNSLNPEQTHDIEQSQSIDNNQPIIENPIDRKEPKIEDGSSNTPDVSISDNSNGS